MYSRVFCFIPQLSSSSIDIGQIKLICSRGGRGREEGVCVWKPRYHI